MKYLRSKSVWVSVGILLTLGYLVLYFVIQQALRLGANEPQISMARNIAAQLKGGKQADDIPKGYIDISSDTAPFIIIYDNFGKVVSGNGYLGSSVPQVPIGVLGAAQNDKVNAVTWQPQAHVRVAAVSAQAGNQYVLVGRSLTVVEDKIDSVGRLLAAAWLVSLVLLIGTSRVVFRSKKQPKPKKTEE